MATWLNAAFAASFVFFVNVCTFALAALMETQANGVHSTFLDADNNFHMAWHFDDSSITFELQVRTRGYVGFGFSPNGGMEGSDVIIGWVDDRTGNVSLTDRHATGNSQPLMDNTQDYRLIAGSQNETHTTLKFTRPLDLCGDEDWQLKADTTRVIWSYHPDDPDSQGSATYHMQRRGTKSIYLLDYRQEESPMPSETMTIDFLMSDVEIPSTKDTTYWCTPFKVPKFDRKVHAIRVDPIITPGHESEVHHIIVYGCYHPTNDSRSEGQGQECYSPNMPRDWWGCSATIFAWAIGGGPFYYPEHAGYPFGAEDDPTMFLVEMHYDNPSLKTNLIDSSGLRVTVTPQLRTYDSGVIQMGVIVGNTQVIPPNAPNFRSDGYCFPECLSQAMENQTSELRIFAVTLHSHLLGRAMRLRHFREGFEQKQIQADEHYDFNLQEMITLKEEVPVIPGDHFIMECDYNSMDRKSTTYGGLSTLHEMCLAFVLYYPRIPLANCQSSPTRSYLAKFSGVEAGTNGTVTSPPEHSGKYWVKVLEETVDWTDASVVKSFQEHINKAGVKGFQPQCSMGSNVFPVNGQEMELPKKLFELNVEVTCGVSRVLGFEMLPLLVLMSLFGIMANVLK